jgi:hypothetical protein
VLGAARRYLGNSSRHRRRTRVAELRGHERQAAEELGQWKTGGEEHKPLDASPVAITLTAAASIRQLVITLVITLGAGVAKFRDDPRLATLRELFGRRLRSLRIERGMSQGAVSESLAARLRLT